MYRLTFICIEFHMHMDIFAQLWTTAEQKNKKTLSSENSAHSSLFFKSRSKITRQEERWCKDPRAIEKRCDAWCWLCCFSYSTAMLCTTFCVLMRTWPFRWEKHPRARKLAHVSVHANTETCMRLNWVQGKVWFILTIRERKRTSFSA